MEEEKLEAERISRTAVIKLDAAIGTVFPLFGPVEEKKWADGWDPVILSPESGTVEEGMVFVTAGNEDHEKSYAWIVSKFQPEDHSIEYTVSTINRYWVISVVCTRLPGSATQAAITYTFTGLNTLGSELNSRAAEAMFRRNLKDWEEQINYFLKTGRPRLSS
jgi:hypothetical protein